MFLLPWIIFFALPVICSSNKKVSYSGSGFSFEGTLNDDGTVSLSLIVTGVASDSNWIALGISKEPDSMANSEIYMGSKTIDVSRFWAKDYGTPTKQSVTNLKSASVKASNACMYVHM
jgi:hypothetical protein